MIPDPNISSIEHERVILGMALFNEKGATNVASIPTHLFSSHMHRRIHQEICRLVDRNHPVDFMSLYSILGDDARNHLINIAAASSSPESLQYRLEELRDIRWQQEIVHLPEDASPEDLQNLIDRFKFNTHQSQSFFLEKSQIHSRIVTFFEQGGPLQYGVGLPVNYHMIKGNLTTITGIPGHGKSVLMDNIIINSALEHGWRWCVFSPESYPIEAHYMRLIEIVSGKTAQPDMSNSLSVDDIDYYLDMLYNKVNLLHIPPDLRDLKTILNTFTPEYDAFVIDPWNEIEHTRPKDLTETEYVARCLMHIKAHASFNEQKAFILAHPTKLRKDDKGRYRPPDPYDISGSAHWYNKSDAVITIFRAEEGVSQFLIKKAKTRYVGVPGSHILRFNRDTNRYYSIHETRDREI